MKYLAIANQAIDMGFSKKVSGRSYQQNICTFNIQRELDLDTEIVLNILFQTFQSILQSRTGQTQVVSYLMDLGDDLITVLLTIADAIQDLTCSHRDLGGIDTVGAEHRAATTLRALMIVAIPLVQGLTGQILGTHQLGEVFTGKGKVAPIYLTQQVLTTHRHVLRILGT